MRSRSAYRREPAQKGRFYAGFVAAGRGFVPPAYGQGDCGERWFPLNSIAGSVPF